MNKKREKLTEKLAENVAEKRGNKVQISMGIWYIFTRIFPLFFGRIFLTFLRQFSTDFKVFLTELSDGT